MQAALLESNPAPASETRRRPLPPRAAIVPGAAAGHDLTGRAAREASLVEALLVDDAAAWRTFTSEYAGVVIACIRRVLCRFTRVTSDHDVDEIYARFCFELLAHDKRKLRKFDGTKGSRLSTWLGLLATNATYDYLRRLRRDRLVEPLPEFELSEPDALSPHDSVVLAEQARLAIQVLGTLSERDREFVELYFAEGIAPEEIAERMGINLKTVYTKKHKITARLESLLARSRAA